MTTLHHLNTFHSHTFTPPNDLSCSPDELHPFQQASCAPQSKQSSCNHAMPFEAIDLIKVMMQDKCTGSMDRVQEISDDESLSSDEERDFVVSGCVSRVNTFGSRGGRSRGGSRMMSRASTYGISRANPFDDHQLQDAMGHMEKGMLEGGGRKRPGEEEEESEEVPLGHLAFIYTETNTQYLLAGDDGDDERCFTPSGPSLGIFCACKHHELGGSIMAYQVTRKWAIFGFCRMKSEMDRRRELFVPFQAQWLLAEEGRLWEGIRNITVGRYVRRVRKRMRREVREERSVMKRWAKVVAGKLPPAFGSWFAVGDEEEQEEDTKADGEQVVNHEARINDLEGDEYDEEPPDLQEGQRTAACALCHLTEIADSTLPTRHPGFLQCGSAPSRETDRGCRSVADRIYTENGNRRIRPVPRGLRRAVGGGDDDGVDDNSGAGDGGGHRDGAVAAERVVGPRPANYEIDPAPPVLKYEYYTAYDMVLRLFGSENRSDLAWNNSYVDSNMEMGLLKDYKEHVEEKIDFSDEEGARKEHLNISGHCGRFNPSLLLLYLITRYLPSSQSNFTQSSTAS